MARKVSTPDYSRFVLNGPETVSAPLPDAPAPAPAHPPADTPPPAEIPPAHNTPANNTAGDIRSVGRPRAARTMRDQAKAFPVYLHPAAKKALARLALELDVKQHDLAIQAFEAMFARHGVRVPVRVQSEDRRPGAASAQADIEDAAHPRRAASRSTKSKA